MHVAFDSTAIFVEVKVIVVDEGVRDGNKRDIACEATVVPPIGIQGGHAVRLAGIIYSDHGKVFAGVQRCSYIAIKRSIAAFMFAGLDTVDPDDALVVRCTNMEEGFVMGNGLEVEVALIPEQAFVVEE